MHFIFFCIYLFSFAVCWATEEQKLLQKQDVQKVMNEILTEHLDEKKITSSILNRSIKSYMDQFDPKKIYLLKEEVTPYIHLNPSKEQALLKQYQANNLSMYGELNALIEKAIQRARKYREELESRYGILFQESRASNAEKVNETEFADTLEQLKQRIKADIIEFIREESQKFGEARVLRDQVKTLSHYEKDKRAFEDLYLGIKEGKPLSEQEKENAFVIHVLKAIAHSLDAHTNVLTFSEADEMRTHLNEGRVGESYESFGNGIIGKITLDSFYQGKEGSSEKDLRAAIEKLKKIGTIKGLVLDFRDNTGGFLSQAVKVAGLFLTNGIVVISKYSNGEEQIYRDIDGTELYNGPLVILTSKETASAAEIVAGALQDYGIALIVGDEHTYGKGTIQSQTITAKDPTESLFKVTVGKYYTVSGRTPQQHGIAADILVPSQYAEERIGEEYLDNVIPADTIPSAYIDTFSDISPSLRPWFLRYYAPKMQHREDVWRDMIPALKRNSAYRIAHNKNYQLLLRQMKDNPRAEEEEEEYNKLNGVGQEDLQMTEATNIIKDMILLESSARHETKK